MAFFSIRKALFLGQLRIPHAERKDNQRHRQADSCNAEKLLNVFIGLHNALSDWCAHGVGFHKGEGISIGALNQCSITQSLVEFPREHLGPNGAGNSVSHGTPNVITGQENTSYHGKVCSMSAEFIEKGISSILYLRSCFVAAWMLAWAVYGNNPPAA